MARSAADGMNSPDDIVESGIAVRTPLPASSDCHAIFAGDSAWLDLLAGHRARYLAASRERHPQLVGLAIAESRSPRPRLRIIYQDQACILDELSSPQAAR